MLLVRNQTTAVIPVRVNYGSVLFMPTLQNSW